MLEAGWIATLTVRPTGACTYTCSKVSLSFVDRYKFKCGLVSQLWHGKRGEESETRVPTERTQSLPAISLLRNLRRRSNSEIFYIMYNLAGHLFHE